LISLHPNISGIDYLSYLSFFIQFLTNWLKLIFRSTFILNSVFMSVILSIRSAEVFKSLILDASSRNSFNLEVGSSACAISVYTLAPSFTEPYLYLIYSSKVPLLNKSIHNIPNCHISNFSLVNFWSLFNIPSGGVSA